MKQKQDSFIRTEESITFTITVSKSISNKQEKKLFKYLMSAEDCNLGIAVVKTCLYKYIEQAFISCGLDSGIEIVKNEKIFPKIKKAFNIKEENINPKELELEIIEEEKVPSKNIVDSFITSFFGDGNKDDG